MKTIRFLDGPAKGVSLHPERLPIMLRAVLDKAGKWDCLDQLDDEAKPDEQIIVYRIEGEPSFAFVDGVNKRGRRTGWRETWAKYRVLPDQPGDEHVRTTKAWGEWCTANKDTLLAGRTP